MKRSIKKLESLPPPKKIFRTSQAFALIDAVLMPDWEYRYFSFNNRWKNDGTEQMASMRDGSGNEYFMHFSQIGVAGKFLVSEQADFDTSLIDMVPDIFSSFKSEPAFKHEQATFYLWSTREIGVWSSSPEKLPEYPLLKFLTDGIDEYTRWAQDYYERDLDDNLLNSIFRNLSIDADQLTKLNPELSIEDIADDLREILR